MIYNCFLYIQKTKKINGLSDKIKNLENSKPGKVLYFLVLLFYIIINIICLRHICKNFL